MIKVIIINNNIISNRVINIISTITITSVIIIMTINFISTITTSMIIIIIIIIIIIMLCVIDVYLCCFLVFGSHEANRNKARRNPNNRTTPHPPYIFCLLRFALLPLLLAAAARTPAGRRSGRSPTPQHT